MNEQTIFTAAIERDPAIRSAYLDGACGADQELRARVDKLIGLHEKTGNFLERPAAGEYPAGEQHLLEKSGTQIGPYKLLQQIGEGGMGTVFMAEQTHPVQRKVAPKIIKAGMNNRQVVARFEAERQALAMMDHVNIARVLDAGATEAGQPYFVMELVHGVPITKYCDDNHLTLHERLELFVPVCHAIQHAHQKGIIHRDIKPSNVMITLYDGKPVPKVIDFGISKATEQKLTERTLFTQYGNVVGTLEYMSPEQAEMSALGVDTRSDIFSLGVLLYELLTGSTPLSQKRLKEAAYGEILRMIMEEEPPKPSTRLSESGEALASISAQRHMEPSKLAKLVRGELDWIVMKALEKDRTRRYETANGLAMDIQRHLADEPVMACPPSAAYRFHKFARRNRAALAMVAVVTVALLLGIVGTTWQAFRATSQRDRAIIAERLAEQNFREARQAVDEYFTLVSENKLLDVPGLQSLRKDLLEAALGFYAKFAVERTNDPGVLADLAVTHLRVAEICHAIGRDDDAIPALDSALDVIDRLRRDYPGATEQHRRLAGYWKGFRPVQKDTISGTISQQAALTSLGRLLGTWQTLAEENPLDVGFQSDLASIYGHLGQLLDFDRPDQAVIFSEKSEQILEALVRRDPKVAEYRADLARTYETLSGTYRRLGRSADLETAFHRSLELNEQLAADFPNVPQYRLDLTVNLRSLARRSETQQPVLTFRRAIDQAKRLVAEFPAVPLYRSLLTEIANDLLTRATHPGPHQQDADKLYRELMIQLTQLVTENPEQSEQLWQSGTALNDIELARLLDRGGQPQEAEIARRHGVRLLEKVAADHSEDRKSRQLLAQSYDDGGAALVAAGRAEEAKKTFRQAADVTAKLASEFPDEGLYRIELVKLLDKSGQPQEAEQALRKAIEIDPKQRNHALLIEILLPRHKHAEAAKLAVELARLQPNKSKSLRAAVYLEQCAAVAHKDTSLQPADMKIASDAYVKQAAELMIEAGNRAAGNGVFENDLAWVLATNPNSELRLPARAVELAKKAVELAPKEGIIWNTLGVAQYRAGDWKAAIAALEKSMELRSGGDSNDWFFLAMAQWQLGQKDEARKHNDQAVAWMEKNQPRNEELKRFRAEAAELIGVQVP